VCMSELIRCEIEDGIAIVRIDRPEKRNAMTYEMLSDFVSTLDAVGSNDKVAVVILTGTDGSFCAGTDLADLDGRPSDERGAGEEDIPPKPINSAHHDACMLNSQFLILNS
jgi:2-(1,2-epoxy-1,2-dihydrophenyl)acetyl-CoA isomerase